MWRLREVWTYRGQDQLAVHDSLGADEMFGDAAHLSTHPSEHEHFQAIYRIQWRMQRGDNHTIMLMLVCNQVVRASLQARLTKKYYEYRKRATDVYQDLWLACKRH